MAHRHRDRPARGPFVPAAALVAAAALVGACSSTPDGGAPPRPPDTVPAPVATTPALDVLPHVTVTLAEQGDRVALRVDAPATVPAGLVRLTVRNDVRDDPAGWGRGLVVVDPAAGTGRADLEAALVSAPERVDSLVVALGGAAALAGGATQEVVVTLAAGRHYLAATGPGPIGSLASAQVVAAPITAITAADTAGAGGTVDPTTPPTPTTTPPSPPTLPDPDGPAAAPGATSFGTVVPSPSVAGQTEVLAGVTVGDITLSDYDAALPDEMGPGWYRVANLGPQPHQLAIVGIDEGHSGREVTDALEQRALADRPTVGTTPPDPSGSVSGSVPPERPGAPPATAAPGPDVPARLHGGLASLSPGAVAWVLLDLGSGPYLALCDRPASLPDAGQSRPDELPHHTHGLAVFFRVA